MTIDVRVATEADWDAIFVVDGRAFGDMMNDAERGRSKRMNDLGRFRLATDGCEVVGVAGSFAFDVALPGGAAVPMGGTTWVAVASTHRRRGILRELLDAVHADIDDRGETIATLYASEGGIYERFGYGAASQRRTVHIDPRSTRIRSVLEPEAGSLRFPSDDEIDTIVPAIWERFWRSRPGEIRRSVAHHDILLERGRDSVGRASRVFHLVHADGYAAYRITQDWNDGLPKHEVNLIELVAVTPSAHLALWHGLLSIDLVGNITTRQLAIDDPLPYLLDNPRAVRTTQLGDAVWVNVRDIAVAFSARTYTTTDRLVIEADGRRWSIDGGPDGGEVRAVRTKPDLVTDHASLGALLYGGVRPSLLVAGHRASARTADALRRADLFFASSVAPNCMTMY